MNYLYKENCIIKIESLFNNLENNVFDEYNNGKISKKEMINIITWCEKVKQSQKKEMEKHEE